MEKVNSMRWMKMIMIWVFLWICSANVQAGQYLEIDDIIIENKKSVYRYGDTIDVSCKINTDCQKVVCKAIFEHSYNVDFEFWLTYNPENKRYEGKSKPLNASVQEDSYELVIVAYEDEWGDFSKQYDRFDGSFIKEYKIVINNKCASGVHTFIYGAWEIDRKATTSHSGSMHRECDVCYQTIVKTIPQIVRKTTDITGLNSSIVLKPGKSYMLSPVIIPCNTTDSLIFTSSNSNIATVNASGYVEAQSAGTCTITVQSGDIRKIIKITVKKSNPYLNIKKIDLHTGDKCSLKLWCATSKVKWKSSNQSVATVSKNGVVKAKKIGKCTITVIHRKKKYKCVVTVKPDSTDFAGNIYDYDTRNNYFIVRIKNMGRKPLIILSSGAKAKNSRYKSFDRNLKISTTIIKPGKQKMIKFKVQGRVTWYDYKDFWISYKFKYDGKIYNGNFYSSIFESDYKKGKKYYYTYLDEDRI